MGKKYKLNKSELTRLKKEGKIYYKFLPVLKLKQEQLQIEQIKIKKAVLQLKHNFDLYIKKYKSLICLLPDYIPIDIVQFVKYSSVKIVYKSIAGVKVPSINKINFNDIHLSYYAYPVWVIKGITKLQNMSSLNVEICFLIKQLELISKELKKATQKVNLFEKVLIPETELAIKRIKIFLGDEQVAAVGRGKIAKAKQNI